MTVAGVISEKYDHFLLEAQMKKVRRLVFKPLSDHIFEFGSQAELHALTRLVETYITEQNELPGRQTWWDGFASAIEGLYMQIPKGARASVSEFRDPTGTRFSGDPRYSEKALLDYAVGKLVTKALATGHLISVAQNGPHLAIVPVTEFGFQPDDTISLPPRLELFPVQKFTEHWCAELGADRLWIARPDDVLPYLGELLERELSGEIRGGHVTHNGSSKRGYAEEDKPFVHRAIQALTSGEVKNVNQAVTLLELSLWKELNPEAASIEDAVAGSGTWSSKRTRLSKKISKRWAAIEALE